MTKFDERTFANLDVVLENVRRGLPNGGDHDTRKYIARKLVQAARKGDTMGGLETIARRALQELSQRKSA